MGNSGLTGLSHIFKKKYSDKQVAEIASREHPTYAMMPRKGGFSGAFTAYAIDYSFPQGIGGTLVGAQAAVSSSKGSELIVYRKPKFGVIRLENEGIRACSSDGALYDFATKEADRVIKEMGDGLAFDLQGDGSGVRGRRLSASTNVITLANAADVRNFKINMLVGASSLATGLTPRTGTTTVTAIDEGLGTITLASAAAIGSFTNNDYLFRATEPGTCMEGMELCTPLTAPVALDSFRGIDRSIDVYGLSGVRVVGTGNIIADIGTAAVKANMRGKKLPKASLNPQNFWTVSQLLNAKVEYDGGGGTAEVGFQFIVVNTPGGQVKIYSDPDTRTDRCRLYNPDAHYLYHLDGLPHLDKNGNGGDIEMRMSTEDAVEVRARAWVNYCQNDTASHGVVSI